MAEPDPRPANASLALPQCAAFIAEWNHKDTSRSTIEKLSKMLDDAEADIDNDDYLRPRLKPAGSTNASATSDLAQQQMAQQQVAQKQPAPPPGTGGRQPSATALSAGQDFVPSRIAYLIDPDKAQAARAALRAYRGLRSG